MAASGIRLIHLIRMRNLPDACLSGAAKLAEHGSLDSKVKVGVLEHNERRVAAELETASLECASSKLCEHTAHPCAAGEAYLLHCRVGGQLCCGLSVLCGADLHYLRRQACLRGELCQCEARVRCFAWRLDDYGASGSKCGCDLAGNH